MSINTRITSFINTLGINSSIFADRIGVQRSSISHILNGRNKPSIDFLEKLHLKYPNLNLEWLITGSGAMYKNISNGVDNKVNTNDLFEFTNVNEEKENSIKKTEEKLTVVNSNISESSSPNQEILKNEKNADFVKNEPDEPYRSKNSPHLESLIPNHKRKDIEKVICFYSDKSFEVFYPQS